jgi:hypothetical protein
MKSKVSLLFSQKPATRAYSKPDQSTPSSTHISLIPILILSFRISLGLPSCLFSQILPIKIPYAPLISPYVPHAMWNLSKIKRSLFRKQSLKLKIRLHVIKKKRNGCQYAFGVPTTKNNTFTGSTSVDAFLA